MPEYLAPGVYPEEVSFRPKSIEGVSTSTAGFVGPTRYGPSKGEPELLTSFGEFQRIYGGLDPLQFADLEESQNYMAYAVRAFFENGGQRLYVSRTFLPVDENDGRAFLSIGSPPDITLRARFPGRAGNMRITFAARVSANLLVGIHPNQVVRGVRIHDVVYVHTRVGASGTPIEGLFDVEGEGTNMTFHPSTGSTVALTDLTPGDHTVHLLNLAVRVLKPGRFEDEMSWDALSPHAQNQNAVQTLFAEEPDTRNRYLTIPFAIETEADSGAEFSNSILSADVWDSLERFVMTDAELLEIGSPPGTERPRLSDLETTYILENGNDGKLPNPETYHGHEAMRDPTTDTFIEASGLFSFEDVDDISMVSAPGYSFRYLQDAADDNARWSAIVQELIIHCQIRMHYRVAILDSPNDFAISEIRNFRGQFDSTHAALYYPWITTIDLFDPDARREIQLPPSGYVAGICARTDIQHGVFKAPANEVVLGAVGFEKLLNKGMQDVLNPEGINCFRFFEGRGFRLWGARTISSDPEWKYFSVRRYFAYLEHSFDRGTQWAVFENNNEALWANIRRTVEDFLFTEWRNGALMGTKPEQAFFVRCDRSTMTQNDRDNGRMICLIGVAVVKPAEYVIFRIGQWTADARS